MRLPIEASRLEVLPRTELLLFTWFYLILYSAVHKIILQLENGLFLAEKVAVLIKKIAVGN